MNARRHAPATERNRDPILAVLRRVLADDARVLEIASGTGQHAVHFAAAMPGVRWQPSDADSENLPSISAWIEHTSVANVELPIALDVTAPNWPVGSVDAIFCANMIHIAPWEACVGLVRGAGRHVRVGGHLLLYGPFRIAGGHTAESNAAFDASLRARDPTWGVRDLETVSELCRASGLDLVERVPMPANNQTVVFRREPGAAP